MPVTMPAASVSTPTVPSAGRAAGSGPGLPGGRAAVFGQVVNRASIAAVFYVALLFVASRYAISLHLELPGEWLMNAVRYLRQTLISGLTVLVAIGACEALLDERRLGPAALLAARAAAVGGGSMLAALLRVQVTYGTLQPMEWSWFVATVGVWTLNGGLGYALLRYARHERSARARLAQAAREREVLSAQGVQARLSALQAQIEPHFLFNTLAHVQRLYDTDPQRGRHMLRALIDYLRAALPTMRLAGSTLRRELDLARSFLTIVQMRMGERLAFEIRADPALLDCAVPPMVLPTLVENAIKHGLAPLPRGGRIGISACRLPDGDLQIEVADDGQGFVASSGSGVGLANTRSRLLALYGERAALSLESGAGGGVVARVRLPAAPAGTPAAPAGEPA